jgi:5'-nucleotidase
MGHAITIGNTLRLTQTDIFGDIQAYQCSGTPADCVKLAKHQILKGRNPDLVVSGINHGANHSISILYSGTMSAAMEGAIEGIPSIGFSLCDFSSQADFSHCKPFIKQICLDALAHKIPDGVVLNVNIPKLPVEEIRGIKVCRQARARFQEKFDERFDPYGLRYYWLVGDFILMDEGNDTDVAALEDGYVSVVPSVFDLTAYHHIHDFKNRLNS